MSEMNREIQGVKTAIADLAANAATNAAAIDKRFEASDERMRAIAIKVASHDERFTRLDAVVDDIQSVNRRIVSTIVRLEGKMDDMAERMATKDDVSGLTKRIDGLSGSYEDMRYRWAVHADTLSDHAKRLKKLEAKRA